MTFKKAIISLIIICSVVFSMVGSVIPASATDTTENTLCKECYTCDDCKICEKCYICDNCKTCEKCYTCDACKTCEECYTCDACKACEECYTCDACKTCEECYTCDACRACEECYICEDCKNCEECYTCDDCRTDEDSLPDDANNGDLPDTDTGGDPSNPDSEDGFGDMTVSTAPLSIDALTVLREYDAIEQFVSRLYSEVLGRAHDEGGLQYWSNLLRSGGAGASVAYGFFFSPEFLGRPGIDNDKYITILYRTFLNRSPDTGGFAYWRNLLHLGFPRENIFEEFVHSTEFAGLCRKSGINPGAYKAPPGALASVFATRLYRTILQRAPDLEGLNFWKYALVNGNATGASMAYGFIFSAEMTSRGLPDDQFVEILYNSLLGRSSDASGKAFWINQLYYGVSRYNVYVGFVNSPEFGTICANHSIVRGTAPPPTHEGSLSGKIIILDAGHGTSGSPGTAGYNEAVAMLDLARRLKPLLEAQGARVILTRDSETNIPISVRCAMINIEALRAVRATRTIPSELAEIDRLIGVMQSIITNPGVNGPRLMNLDPFNATKQIHPDLRRIFEITNNPVVRSNFLVISLHSNATGNGSTATNGAEVYFIDPGAHANTRTYYPGFSYTGQSRSFGNILLNHIHSSGIARRSNGLRAENYAMIREINVPAVLAENGFHTNPNDRALLSSPTYRQNLATAYRNAITEYFR